MNDLKIKDIIEITKGKLIVGNIEDKCKSFCKDTRILKKDDTYIGIKGENFDGNKLWKNAFENGAKTVIVENIDFEENDIKNFANKNIILVKSTMDAIKEIATYKRSLYNIPVVGITGSVGKTSTKDIIANVISQKYKTLKTQGNNNNNIGLPFTLFRLDDHEAAVIEMGMNHLGEINYLTNIAKPTISVITNIGTSHIGNLGSRENILKAKLEILDGMSKNVLVINNDNDLLHKFYEENKENKDIEIHTFGIMEDSEFMAKNLFLNENYSKFDCTINKKNVNFKVPVGGKHFIYNALSAIAVGNILKLSEEQIKTGIEKFELTKRRMDIIELKNGVKLINDTYNASFESMKATLDYLGNMKANRKIAVLGDMLELGKFSKELHEKVGIEVAKNNIDLLILSGNNAKFIGEAAIKNKMNEKNIYYFESKNEISNFLINNWKKGDVILLKASNGMKFFEITEKLEESL